MECLLMVKLLWFPSCILSLYFYLYPSISIFVFNRKMLLRWFWSITAAFGVTCAQQRCYTLLVAVLFKLSQVSCSFYYTSIFCKLCSTLPRVKGGLWEADPCCSIIARSRTLVLEALNRVHFLNGFQATSCSAYSKMSDKAGTHCLGPSVQQSVWYVVFT